MTDSALLESPSPRVTRAFYYGWVNVVVAAVAMVATLPGRTHGLGMVTKGLLRDMGIGEVDFAMQNLWATLIGSTFSLACGPLIDRFGARVVLVAALTALGGSILAMTHVETAAGLLVTLTLTRGFGQSALSVASLALVGKWFSRRLPMAMGVYCVVSGIGFVVAFKCIGTAAISDDPRHWRVVWGAMGWGLLIGLAPLSCLLARRTPESMGLRVDDLPDESPVPISEVPIPDATIPDDEVQTGYTLHEALRSPAFWAYALAASAFALISSGLTLFNAAVLEEHQFDSHMAIKVMTVVMFTGLLANFAAGWMAQKLSMGQLMAGAMLVLGAALSFLPVANGTAMVYVYAVLMGAAGGIVTVVFAAAWGKVFGRRHLGAIQGVAQALTVIASAFGPICLAASRWRFHSSSPLFYCLAGVSGALGLFCALAPTPVGRETAGDNAPKNDT